MRMLLYSHDTYGLGHFRRCSLLAAGLVGTHEEVEVLIVTGSPRTQSFRLPDRVDTVKLPTATKDAGGRYRARTLGMDLPGLVALRSDLIGSTISSYRPDVVLVDHAPLGMGRELVPILDRLSSQTNRPRMVLGLRDIVDEAARVDSAWRRDGIWERLDAYDQILVYGDERVTTTATELGLATRSKASIHHTGYVAPAMPEPATDEPFLLVTAGGGGDGQAMLRSYLDAVEGGATGNVRSVVVTGPLLSSGRRAELMMRASNLPGVEIIEFTDRLRLLISSALGVVSMAGYNTVVELLAANRPALLVPRCTPRLEQHLRSTRLSAVVPKMEHCPMELLNGARIESFVQRCRTEVTDPSMVDLGGVRRAVDLLVNDRTPGPLEPVPSRHAAAPPFPGSTPLTQPPSLVEGATHG